MSIFVSNKDTMKKIVTFLLLSLISFITTSQTFLKSDMVTIGILDKETQTFVFQDPFEINDVLIKLNDIDLIIYSQEQQEYYIYSEEYEFNGGTATYWFAFDKKGVKCRIYLYKNELNKVFLGIEYSDVCWVYTLKVIE